MKNNLINLGLVASLALLTWVAVGQYHEASSNADNARKVQLVQMTCDKAHHEFSGASEEACGQAQDSTDTEYLCASAQPDASCWVEVK